MKQLLQNLRTGETQIVDVPIPTPQAGQALVRTAASLVSAGTERMVVEFAEKSLLGKARSRPDLVRQVLDKARREGLLTTLEAAFSRLEQPMELGYSSAGVVAALGDGVQNLRLGQRVACAGGGYAVHAEYACVPTNLLTPLPEAVDFEAAAFTTLGAIALHGFRLSQAQIGERVAVIGLGLLGLLSVQIAQAAGCQVFGVDLLDERIRLAQRFGAQAAHVEQAVEAAASFSRGRGCDAVLICADSSSSEPVELAGAIARDRARVIAVGAVGLNLPRKIYYEKELTFINSRSYGPGRYDPDYEEGGHDYPLGYVRWTEGRNLEAVVDLLASGKVDVHPLITHRFPIHHAPQAYELITGKRKAPFLGVLLTYAQEETGIETLETKPKPGVATPSAAFPEAPAPQREPGPVRMGVLGAGNFASAVMLPALRSVRNVQLIGVASASGTSAQHAANRFGFQYADSDPARLLEDAHIEAVVLLTRHHLHAQQTLAALRAGKHVFCEKPLALNPKELDEIEAMLRSCPAQILTVGFNRRFAPMAIRLKTFLQARQEPLAAHYRVNAGYLPSNHWTQDPHQGGGRIIGEACHFIDFLTFLVGAVPVEVAARGLPDDGRYRQDNVVISLSFPDGSLGTVSYLANGDKAFPKERLEVFSGGRVAVLDDYRSLELVSQGSRKVYTARLRQDKGHRAEMQTFANAIQSGGPPPIPYGQIFGVMRAAFAAVESLRSGSPVRLGGAQESPTA